MVILFFILGGYGVFFAILMTVVVVTDIQTKRRKKKAEKAVSSKAPTAWQNMSIPKNEVFKAALERLVWENFDVPLIHSTEHNTTIYAHKANA